MISLEPTPENSQNMNDDYPKPAPIEGNVDDHDSQESSQEKQVLIFDAFLYKVVLNGQ